LVHKQNFRPIQGTAILSVGLEFEFHEIKWIFLAIARLRVWFRKEGSKKQNIWEAEILAEHACAFVGAVLLRVAEVRHVGS